MTGRQRKALERWTQEAATRLRLPAWRIEIMAEPAAKGIEARIWITREADIARLYLGRNFWKLSERERRLTATHELLHLHLDRLFTMPLYSLTFGTEFDAAYRIEYERMTDRLAVIVTPLMPKLLE